MPARLRIPPLTLRPLTRREGLSRARSRSWSPNRAGGRSVVGGRGWNARRSRCWGSKRTEGRVIRAKLAPQVFYLHCYDSFSNRVRSEA